MLLRGFCHLFAILGIGIACCSVSVTASTQQQSDISANNEIRALTDRLVHARNDFLANKVSQSIVAAENVYLTSVIKRGFDFPLAQEARTLLLLGRSERYETLQLVDLANEVTTKSNTLPRVREYSQLFRKQLGLNSQRTIRTDVLLSLLLFQVGNRAEALARAVDTSNRAITQFGYQHPAAVYALLVQIYVMSGLGRLDDAKSLFSALERIDHSHLPIELRLTIKYFQGSVDFSLRDYVAASETLEQFLSEGRRVVNPNSALLINAELARAKSLLFLRRFDEVVATQNRINEIQRAAANTTKRYSPQSSINVMRGIAPVSRTLA